MFACFFVIGCVISFGGPKKDDARIAHPSVIDPLNASYMVEGQKIRLIDGRSETEAAPGSAAKVITSVFGKPVYGNIDGQGDVDAALILTYDSGGSGTFFYVAAALNVKGNYRGTHAVLLGDRVAPQNVSVRNGVIVANYVDRRPEESMAASPSVGRSKYLIIESDVLKEIAPIAKDEQVHGGWTIIGHEVRTFTSCQQQDRELWLLGNSPALNEIMAAYRKALPGPMPYTPLFITLAGKHTQAPGDGFGAEYKEAYFATQLIRVFPKGNCKSDLILMDLPLPGALVASPLRIRGHARGKWFFEGDFPIVLKDANGKDIAKGFATAKEEWMTEKFVPFEGMIEFKRPGSGSKGTLVLKKDNPTDRPEFDDALEIPIFFK